MSRALVVSGGGCKGAYAVGVAKVLMNEADLTFDVVSGTSTGGLVCPFVAAKRIDAAETFYTTVTTDDILKFRKASEVLRAPSFATYAPLVNKVREAVAGIGADNILSAETQMFMAATRLQDRNAVFFHNQDAPAGVTDLPFNKIEDEEELVRAMVATASVPGIAPPVDIGQYQFVDGGVREITPLIVPVSMAIDEIYVILLSPQTSEIADTRYESLLSILGRTADALTTDVSRRDLDPIARGADLATLFEDASASISDATDLSADQVREMLTAANPRLGALADAKFTVVGPSEQLTDNSMEFDPAKMKEMVTKGEADARAVVG